jgi:UPF0271 protein
MRPSSALPSARIPACPNLLGFGRRRLEITPDEAYALVVYQIGALEAFMRARGQQLNHVKPHGALYGTLNGSPELAEATVQAVVDTMPDPVIYWPAGVEHLAFVQAARAADVHVVGEYFPDLSYRRSGEHVAERHKANLDPATAVARVRRFLLGGLVDTIDGDPIQLSARSICVHGDGPTAPAIVTELGALMTELGYEREAAAAGLRGSREGS